LNTGLHFIVLIALVKGGILASDLANVVAFLCANVCSYCLNSRFTFRSASSLSQYLRFLLCSGLGAVIAYTAARLTELAGWNYLAGALVTVMLMPPVNFWCARRFAFNIEKEIPNNEP
jgi:putative flippase GtrA